MRIGIVSHPMLFQRDRDMQQQVRATMQALGQITAWQGRPMRVEPVNPHATALDGLDVLHVFSATHGNSRWVDEAAARGVPVVLTPLIAPGWNAAAGRSARMGERGFGNLTAWNVQTGYAQTRSALQQASLILALGQAEREAIGTGFLVDAAKVRVFPAGISPHLFSATGALFRMRTGIAGPFALVAGPVSPYANTLALAQTLARLALPVVLVGETRERDQDYLRQVRAVRGVTCLGGMDHDGAMLASAYAAASVFVLPGAGSPAIHGALDALAAGTPVVMAAGAAPDLAHSSFALAQVNWDDGSTAARAIAALAEAAPPREQVRDLVRGHTWQRLADRIAGCYAALAGAGLSVPAANPAPAGLPCEDLPYEDVAGAGAAERQLAAGLREMCAPPLMAHAFLGG